MTGKKKKFYFHTWNWSRNFLVDRNKKKIEKRINVQFLLKQKHYHKFYFLKLALNKC